MSEQIPAGWYPDPKDTTSEPRPQRWWDGKGWTADTRPAPADAPAPGAAQADAPQAEPTAAAGTAEQPRVLEGEVLDSGPTVRFPEPPAFGAAYGSPAGPPPRPRRKPSKLALATTVAALLGLGAGSGITYLAMDGHGDRSPRGSARPAPQGGYGPWGNGIPGFGDPGNGDGDGSGGSGGNGGSGKGGKGGGGKGNGKLLPGTDQAIDVVNRLTLPVPDGWEAGTTNQGYAMITVGSYTCADGKSSCTLGGVNTGKIDGGGTDVQAAARADIAGAAKDAYGEITGHQELKSEAVKVNGQDGYLVRWKVDAPKGNNGYVETVVFPSADGKSLVSVHFGFDIADKAPDVAVMDTVVQGITAYKGKLPTLPGLPGSGSGSGGTSGSTT
ncbi:DUF2510 domain-containing protein [Kitasatospora brasiliensis]|uniref:DUF2510 domain-containing protein n=1 Tax=Kitasatospora brasiliensis TaxID=3058040 RepID=UPI00292F6257|nr:DUF2510 domain-containing protein [Kitasatospora sp. K002]